MERYRDQDRYRAGIAHGQAGQPEAPARGGFAGRGPRSYRRSDDAIREDVCERLTHHPDIDASEMEVQVSGGQVTLTGSVEDRQQKWLAEDAAEAVPGVVEVHNLLRVGRGLLERVGEALGLSGDPKSNYV